MEITLPSRPKDGPSSPKLCSACSQLRLASMFAQETKQIPMGPVSDYTDPNCPFCNLITKSVRQAWGGKEDPVADKDHPLELFIQSRSPLSIKIDGHIRHPEPRILLAVNHKPAGLHEARGVIRQVDRVKDRFIVAEIERLPDDTSKESSYVVRRDVGTRVDVDLVKSWLNECSGKHKHSVDGKTVGVNNALFEGGFRLIDVKDECLVTVPEKRDYVALSYVWGRLSTILKPNEDTPDAVPLIQATNANVKALGDPKALSPANMSGMKMAQTVLDAMDFTRALGQRYLWVDTLCIIQDGKSKDGQKTEKDRLMALMDDIYNNAVTTLIAADGNDAEAGIRGWGEPHRRGRPIEPTTVVDNDGGQTLRLSICPPSLTEEVRQSKWSTRGWTFQEQHLSRRCVYFTREEVFFACVDGQRRESYYLSSKSADKIELRTGPPWWTNNLRHDPDPTPYHYLGDPSVLDVHDYQVAVQAYSRMDLSHLSDALNAFAGVFNRFNKAAGGGVLSLVQSQGIPVQFLHQGLLWFPSDGAKRRPLEDGNFSTWSWASWIGAAEFVFADSAWLSRIISLAPTTKGVPFHTAIPSWHFGVSDGSISRFWAPNWQGSAVGDGTASPPRTETPKTRGVKPSKGGSATYLDGKLGVSTATLRENSSPRGPEVSLGIGQLGFYAAYLLSKEVQLAAKKSPKAERIVTMELPGGHHGEFRFDDNEARAITEFVLVVASDTVAKQPKTQSIFLGVSTTPDGLSRRIGIGFVYYSSAMSVEEAVNKPAWEYKQFKLV
ncbi:heterokaryon incompatibility protein-domain-containing protein [Podospora didyma]|uniref:Heterokaryon incompatibility protein-domain-containing protein n=1 Tax=Podospora didyma TaxID=330526 RepID=A0AAE0K229_9PEZI|nr:heterokaryon incompatibility protein-domain-containing protein [Podospora didyma]